MSFSSQIKERLCGIQLSCEPCICAELAGIVGFAGVWKGQILKITTENEKASRRIAADFLEVIGPGLEAVEGKTSRFIVKDPYVLENLAARLMIFEQEPAENRLGLLMPLDCCRASYIRGAFIGGGSVSDPNKSYHLEFDTKNKDGALLLQEVLFQQGLSAKVTYRKGHHIVYMKEAEGIGDTLSLMGAGGGALELYTIQVEKEMRNSVNRQVNCETANVDKTVRAASRQAAAIHKLKRHMDMAKLPEVLQEIAALRLEYPEASLKDLGELLNPPIGKSGVNHRLNRLVELADEIKEPKRKREE